MEAVVHGNGHIAEFVHDVAGGDGLKAVVLNGLPVIPEVQPLAVVRGAAFHDGSVQLVDQRRDESRLQEIMPAGFACGNLHRDSVLQRMPQSFIYPDQAFRCNGAGEIDLCRFPRPGRRRCLRLAPVGGHAVESDASHGHSTGFQECSPGKMSLAAHSCLLELYEPCYAAHPSSPFS